MLNAAEVRLGPYSGVYHEKLTVAVVNQVSPTTSWQGGHHRRSFISLHTHDLADRRWEGGHITADSPSVSGGPAVPPAMPFFSLDERTEVVAASQAELSPQGDFLVGVFVGILCVWFPILVVMCSGIHGDAVYMA